MGGRGVLFGARLTRNSPVFRPRGDVHRFFPFLGVRLAEPKLGFPQTGELLIGVLLIGGRGYKSRAPNSSLPTPFYVEIDLSQFQIGGGCFG